MVLHNFDDQVIGLSTYYLVMAREKRGALLSSNCADAYLALLTNG
ncbi:hypothetical protein IMCC26256_11503 [Actinobacteria bacterium IMCC26256]|nr:hypothetical protein IMCC26256_11503 [Actinobacteria bacterium IMCC26256]